MVSRFFFRYTGRRLHLSGAPVFSVKPRYPLAVLFSSFFGGQLCELCREKYLVRSSLEYSRPLGASLCIVALGMDADGSYHAVVVSVLMRNAEGALAWSRALCGLCQNASFRCPCLGFCVEVF